MKSYLFPFLCIISLCLLFNSKSHLYIDKKKVYRLILVYILKKVYIIFINKLDNKNTGVGVFCKGERLASGTYAEGKDMEKARVSGDRKTMKVIGGFSKMRKLQKTISFLLSLVLTLGLCIATVPGEVKAAEGVQFTVNASKTGELRRGETFDVTVSMSGNTQGQGLTYELLFDSSKLKVVGDPVAGDVFNGLGQVPNKAFDGQSIFAAPLDLSGGILKNGTLMTATFQVLDTATAGEIGFSSKINVVSGEGDSLPVASDNAGSIRFDIVTPVITLDKAVLNLVKGGTDKLTATLKYAEGDG